MKNKVTAAQARAEFLEKAMPAMRYKFAEAGGSKDFKKDLDNTYFDPNAVERIWDALIPMLQKESDARIIEARTSSDIIKAVCDGKITIDEAFKLMEIMVNKTNIDLANDVMKAAPDGQD